MKQLKIEVNNKTRTKICDSGEVMVLPHHINEHIEVYKDPTAPYETAFLTRFDTHEGAVIKNTVPLYALSKEQTLSLLVVERDAAD